MYNDKSFRDLAHLAVTTGVNLKPGQNLVISTNPGTYGFARLVAEEAYKVGAIFVRILQEDQYLNTHRARYVSPKDWDYYPEFLVNEFKTYAQESWARIALEDMEDLDVGSGDLQEALGHFRKVRSQKLATYREAQIRDQFPWCVLAIPGPKWAKRLGMSTHELWEILKPINRLDRADPAHAWKEAGNLLESRGEMLTALNLKSLRFQSPGTDLQIGLIPGGRWLGGGAQTPDGRSFMPNIPTEEVFTTPDWRLTQGRVQVTRPVEVLGTLVKGAWFVYENGLVVDYGAQEGQESLKNYLAIDPQAGCLGEVALVDGGNPIAQSKILFGSILLDENASCHMALGFGYPHALPPGTDASGCNVTLVHTDFMIGSDDLTVTGLTDKDREVVLVEKGRIVLN